MADQPSAGNPDHEASFALNLASWDERAPAHAASADYGFARFAEDPEHLSDVVRFDLPRLGDVRGLDGVHLQCHIGTDTVSLARLGARDDRARLLRRPPSPRPAPGRAAADADVDVRRGRRLRRRRRCSGGSASTSSSPASARSAGCPTSAAGPAVVDGLLAPGRPAVPARGPPDAVVAGRRAHRRADRRRAPVLRAAPSRSSCRRGGTYVETDARVHAHRHARRGTTGSARSSPRCSTAASC